ncbi:MAG: hypothetical protein GXP55_06160, partial [Deltaproteobacteria bacterium]|nr:hypothetical protein [Deltaproteobacteria bacterium]
MKRPLLLLFSCLALFFFGAQAHAATVEALDLTALTQAADEVFVAEAVAADVHRDARGRIVTDVRVRVAESLLGERAAGEEVVLRCLGGSLDGIGMRVPGEAQLAVGETALVFARRADGGWLRAVGMSQGVLPMRAGAQGWLVEPGGAGLSLVRRSGAGRLLRAAP